MVIKENGEDHTDCDGVSDIGHEEDGLEDLLKSLDGVEGDSDGKSDDDRKRNSDEGDEQGVRQGNFNELIFI